MPFCFSADRIRLYSRSMKTSAIRPATPLPDAGGRHRFEPSLVAQDRGLSARWSQRRRFVLLDTQFGDAGNFLASWALWRQDPQRCERLVFIAVDEHPLTAADLKLALQAAPAPDLAHQLHAAWPALTHNLHRLSFESGRVQLLLAFGDMKQWLSELVASIDSFYLPQSGPSQLWDRYALKSLTRLAAPGAHLFATGQSEALNQELTRAGFAAQPVDGITAARYAPRFVVQQPLGRQALTPDARQAIVIGGGLAGCAAAWALSGQGLDVTLIDQRPAVAQASSGNPLGLFHGTLNPADGLHARFNRAAALEMQRVLSRLDLPSRIQGLLRTESTRSLAQMQALLDTLGLPPDYVQALSPSDVSAASGLASSMPAWYYPGGGALSPQELTRAFLEQAERPVTMRMNTRVKRLQRASEQWQLIGDDDQVLAQTPLLVIAAGASSLELLPDQAWPLRVQRGQVTRVAGDTKGLLVPALPMAGAGYMVPDGSGGVWCGATAQDEDPDPLVREQDHAHNLAQLMRLSHADIVAPPLNQLQGRVGWRLIAEDRLPIVGAPAQTEVQAGIRGETARFIARQPGLLVSTAMASRGICWAALSAQVLAALATGAPCPVEASLLDAIDPARFDARRARARRV